MRGKEYGGESAKIWVARNIDKKCGQRERERKENHAEKNEDRKEKGEKERKKQRTR